MADTTRVHPVELLRNLLTAVDRLAGEVASRPPGEPGDRVRKAAEAAVRGAADEWTARFPESDEALDVLVHDGLQVLAHIAHEAAEHPPGPTGEWSRNAAAGAVRGAVEELRDVAPRLRLLIEQLADRLNRSLEKSGSADEERARLIREPGGVARQAAAGAVQGALGELRREMPQVAAELRLLAPVAEELGRAVGQGLVSAMAQQFRQEQARAGSPLLTQVERLAQRGSAAAVRGVSEELAQQLRQWRARPRGELRQTFGALIGGAWDAMAVRLRGPAIAATTGLGLVLVTRFAIASRR